MSESRRFGGGRLGKKVTMAFGRHRVAAAVCLPLLALLGCSEDPEPIIEPPAETTSAADPSPTQSPEAKEPWEKKTKAGAVAFAEHWIDVFNSAAVSGEVGPVRELSMDSCRTCANFVDFIEEIHGNGGSFESAGWQVASVSFARPEVANDLSLALKIQQPSETIRRPGEPVERTDPGTATYQADLVWEGEAWRMADLLLVEDLA